ncbi:MAG: adenosylcobinamide-GDP ribazoletransferase [Pseudomonadota bacterium]|nr:adenosylcobinamide-GDP ribazoletransferase [Pseudomonadota bacterium]MEE3071500.1 adenosylcobinamide-GDP ribazoletransferase [Pseudomonadota bacterium]
MTQRSFHWQDLPAALGLLSRLPISVDPARATARSAEATWAYPIAGAILGACTGTAALAAQFIGLPPVAQALAALTASVILTGAMHEDGLADSADGLWGGWTKDRRLEIMKDSRTGAYGVIAIALSLLWRAALLTTLFEATPQMALPICIGLGALSRAGLPLMMGQMPQARQGGLSASVGRPKALPAIVGPMIGIAIALPLIGLFPCLAAAIILGLWAAIAMRKIGGQTGDILGASQQLTEIAALIALTASLL